MAQRTPRPAHGRRALTRSSDELAQRRQDLPWVRADKDHAYSAYARGLEGLWGMYQWLDRAPRGRNELRTLDGPLNWYRRRDEYANEH
jgi:predicted dithiol-disulfide oxidoreductase (DUF899 family)